MRRAKTRFGEGQALSILQFFRSDETCRHKHLPASGKGRSIMMRAACETNGSSATHLPGACSHPTVSSWFSLCRGGAFDLGTIPMGTMVLGILPSRCRGVK